MELNVIIKQPLTNELLKPINRIIGCTRGGGITCEEVWHNIQHIDMFFDEHYKLGNENYGIIATFDKKDNIIDFINSDGTLLFYVS